jgi:hypothetical protein
MPAYNITARAVAISNDVHKQHSQPQMKGVICIRSLPTIAEIPDVKDS